MVIVRGQFAFVGEIPLVQLPGGLFTSWTLSGGDPAPGVRAIVIAGGHELVNAFTAFFERSA